MSGETHVEIEELGGVGFGRNKADWWIFTDGIKQIRKNRWGTTSIRHHNGTYVDIPTALLSPEDLQKLEAGMNEVSRLLGKSAAIIPENLDEPPCANSRLTTTCRPKTNSVWPTNVWFSG